MQKMQKKKKRMKKNLTKIIVAVVILITIGVASYFAWVMYKENQTLKSEKAALTVQLQSVSDSLSHIQNQNSGLANELSSVKDKNADYSSKLDETTTKVEALERITKTDPQLLYKYSKVFFLNENYTPPEVTPIDTKYLYNKDKPLQFHDRAWPFLRNLFNDASQSGIDLLAISAYRSFGTQAALKSTYKVTYGAGTANSFSADQGYSEHQLATTLDFTTPKVGGTFSGFEKTDAYKWLLANAYKYGFILSYPAGNKFYVYEPWHWRFVGLDLALKLHNENKNFYDMDQREINTYLGVVFNGVVTEVK